MSNIKTTSPVEEANKILDAADLVKGVLDVAKNSDLRLKLWDIYADLKNTATQVLLKESE